MPKQLSSDSDAADLFERLRDRYPIDSKRPARGFGSDALTSDGRIFAALSHGKLLLKLPRPRVDELISTHVAEPFVLRERVMREWLLLPVQRAELWPVLAEEAHRFVSGV
jgi:hypothetical protein